MLGVTDKIENAARKAAFFSFGGVLCAVGAGFLTVAAWIVLDGIYSTEVAAFIIGSVYMGAGLIMVGLASRGKPDRRHGVPKTKTPEGELSPMQAVAVSFLQGMEQGAAVRASR